ncbi:hypothetical protein EI555_017896, partial [Monodon monoceros]
CNPWDPRHPLSPGLANTVFCGVSHFCELAQQKHEGTDHLFKMQNQCGSCTLLQNMQKPSQEEWSETLEKTLN